MKKYSFRGFILLLVLGLIIPIAGSVGAEDPVGRGPALGSQAKSRPEPTLSQGNASHWIRAYYFFPSGLAGDDYYSATSLLPTGDGGFVVAGNILHLFPYPPGGSTQISLIMGVQSSGAIDWQFFCQDVPPNVRNIALSSLVRTQDGGYLAAGSMGSDESPGSYIMAMKISPEGRVDWFNKYGITNTYRVSAAATNDGGAVLTAGTGSDRSHLDEDIWVARIGPAGNIIWQQVMGTDDLDLPNAIQPTPEEGFLIVGSQGSWDYPGNGCVIKLDPNGQMEWNKLLHFDSDYNGGEADAIVCEPDGSFMVSGLAGDSCDCGGGYWAWVFKMDPSGGMIWQAGYDSKTSSYGPFGLMISGDGGYLFTQRSSAYKITSSGEPQWQTTYTDAEVGAAIPTEQGGFALAVVLGSPYAIGVMNLDEKGTIGTPCPLIQTALPDSWETSAKVLSGSYAIRKTNAQVQSFNYHPSSRPCLVKMICAQVPRLASDPPGRIR